jgi:hypothetical protein
MNGPTNMSTPVPPQPAKLVVGIILSQRRLLDNVARLLKNTYGEIDMVSPWFGFDFTEYYASEMGSPLYRRLLVFRELVAQEELARIKHRTNDVEHRFSREGRRQVNLDPGVLLYERFVLATGKNYSHRIYIGRRIYADLTLVFQNGGYQILPWTYPDYAAEVMRAFLLQVRRKYAEDLASYKKAIPGSDEEYKGV